MRLLIQNAGILTPTALLNSAVYAENGRILSVAPRIDPPEGTHVIDAQGLYLSPGFIDLHVHGGGGFSAMDAVPDAIVGMANAHARYGTTTLLPTTLAAPAAALRAVGEAVRDAMARADCSATIAGVHFEGPCLSPAQAGAQAKDALSVPSDVDLSPLFARDIPMRMMGVAPELDGAMALGERIAAHGAVASVAHSDASYACVRQSLGHGFSDITHLYSGCSTVRRERAFRVPGVVEAGLNLDDVTVQVIADGCHLPPELIALIYRCKGAGGMYLITDGLEPSAMEMPEGTVYTQRNGVPTLYEDGVMKLMDRSAFAGSAATMNRLVRVARDAGLPLRDAVRMATETPARRIGLTAKGCIAPGYDADLVLFDDAVQIRFCFARDRIVHMEKIGG